MTSAKASPPLRIRLYIAAGSPNSVAALANLRRALREGPAGLGDHLEVIDVVRDPERGVRDGVLVTPLLVKLAPLPERRILGNLHEREALLALLGLDGRPGE